MLKTLWKSSESCNAAVRGKFYAVQDNPPWSIALENLWRLKQILISAVAFDFAIVSYSWEVEINWMAPQHGALNQSLWCQRIQCGPLTAMQHFFRKATLIENNVSFLLSMGLLECMLSRAILLYFSSIALQNVMLWAIIDWLQVKFMYLQLRTTI